MAPACGCVVPSLASVKHIFTDGATGLLGQLRPGSGPSVGLSLHLPHTDTPCRRSSCLGDWEGTGHLLSGLVQLCPARPALAVLQRPGCCCSQAFRWLSKCPPECLALDQKYGDVPMSSLVPRPPLMQGTSSRRPEPERLTARLLQVVQLHGGSVVTVTTE